jgi:hypothetical protein
MLNKVLESEIAAVLQQHGVKSLLEQNLIIEIALIEGQNEEHQYKLLARLFSVEKDSHQWHNSIKEHLAGMRILGRSLKDISEKLEYW